jgi:acid phosphatase
MNGTRLAQLQSFTDFTGDLSSNNLPQYAHMSPDMLNDGHDTSLAYATNWTLAFLTPLLSNSYFMERTLVLLTYDESATYPIPNKIASLLLGGAVPQSLKGTKDDTIYSHYSILSTLENNWELPNLGRYDVGANVFSVVASQTGYVNHPPSNLNSLNNSLSYGGFLNNQPKLNMSVPAPNLQLVGAGGNGVVPTVLEAWGSAKDEKTPYDGSGTFHDGGNGIDDPNAPIYNAQGPAASVTATGTRTSPTQKSGASKVYMTLADVGFGLGVLVLAVLHTFA